VVGTSAFSRALRVRAASSRLGREMHVPRLLGHSVGAATSRRNCLSEYCFRGNVRSCDRVQSRTVTAFVHAAHLLFTAVIEFQRV